MFKHIKTFKELVKVAEQTSQQAYDQRQKDLTSQGAVAPSPTKAGSRLGALGNMATKAAGLIGNLDPSKLAAKVRGIEAQGAVATAAQAMGALGAALTDSSRRKLEDFLFKSQFPQGWPKKGSKFRYIPVTNSLKGADKKGITGEVTSVNQSGDNLVLAIDFLQAGTPHQTQMPFAKRATGVISTKQRQNPNYSLVQWEVQDIVPGRGAVRDSENSAHQGRYFSFNPTSAEFIYNQASDIESSDPNTPPYIDVSELQTTYKINTPSIGTTFNYKTTGGVDIPMKIMSGTTELTSKSGNKMNVVIISPVYR